jgi:type II secretory pathway component PulK
MRREENATAEIPVLVVVVIVVVVVGVEATRLRWR